MRRARLLLGIALGLLGGAVADAADLTTERLTNGEWRVFSEVFAALPGEGYPIRFRPQGTVETANLARVTQWTLTATGELALQEKDGESLWTFRWYPARSLLVSCPRAPQSALPPLVLAPPGSTSATVGEALATLGLSRCAPGPPG